MYFSFDSFRSRLIKYLDICPETFDQGLLEWIEKHGDGVVSQSNYLCTLYYTLADSITRTASNKNEEFIKKRFIYGELYAFKTYHDEECNDVLRLMHHCDLQIANSENIKIEAVIRTGNCCPDCDKQEGKIFSIEEALLLQPLPNRSCSNEDGCICSYGFHSVRDLNNKIIKKSIIHK